MRLSNRLGAVAAFIEEGAAVADVGTDHGLLPVYLALNGLARRIIASDISAGSLLAARRSASRYGVGDMVTFIAAPGLAGVRESDVDTVVIAGVGGETIIDILSGAPWLKPCGVKLILQPQTKIGELCGWMRDNGYIILDAALALDKGRFYVAMLAGAGNTDAALSPETELLSMLGKKGGPYFADYVNGLIANTRMAADSMEIAGAPEYPLMKKRLEELSKLL